MSLKNGIIEKLKEISGSILLIGIYDQIAFQVVDNNDKITDCMIINDNKFTYNNLDQTKGRIKHYNIKKIRKTFKKKTLDNIVANYNEIKKKMHHFIKNSIYINKGKIFIYCEKDVDYDELIRRYKRYNTTINETKNEDYTLIEIDTSKAKNNRLKDIKYTISDIIYIGVDFIGDLLTN